MYRYFIKTPWWVKKLFSSYVWSIPSNEKVVYLTFDDGPHPTITPWVLHELKKHSAKATFFCIGDNVVKYQEVYNNILAEGHAVGNHTYHHLNGWKVPTIRYLDDIRLASNKIDSNLFRPPYGRIKKLQAKGLAAAMCRNGAAVIMWDVLSGDFDSDITSTQCKKNIFDNVKPGAIIVFHDSEKAEVNLKSSLPFVLESLYSEGYECRKIVIESE